MDEPARKRRKTNSPEEPERQSSPLRRKPVRRPSFASPTKASLARNYPNLLRPNSAKGDNSRPIGRGSTFTQGKQPRTFAVGETDTRRGLGESDLEDANELTGGVQQLPSATRDFTPRARIAGEYANTPTLTRPLEEEEGDLSATSAQTGLQEQDDPLRGVEFSSPSKRSLNAKDPLKRSPLKPRIPKAPINAPVHSIEERSEEVEDPAAEETKQPPDPEVEKRKQEKARMQRELEELEGQILKCAEEIAKEQQRGPNESLRSTERSDLIEFITKISDVKSKEEQPAPVSTLLCSLLPFSALIVPRPRSSQPQKPVPSHRPIELQNPLPFLEMFTSLKFSTQLGLPRTKIVPSSKRVHQKHTIDITGPQKLLTAQISVLIDSLSNEVADLRILRLSSWAERELGTFIRGKAKEKEIGNACWAVDSYWAIAQKRAEYWSKCQTSFAHLVAGHTEEDTENIRPLTKPAQLISRKDLNRHLGRDTFVLQDKHVLLKLNWRIGFDWTGEAASEITVEPAVPQVWQEADITSSFKKVPETFTALLRDKGAYEATRILVALLFAQ